MVPTVRSVKRDPAAVRRLLTARHVNPSFGMVTDMAAALVLRLS